MLISLKVRNYDLYELKPAVRRSSTTVKIKFSRSQSEKSAFNALSGVNLNKKKRLEKCRLGKKSMSQKKRSSAIVTTGKYYPLSHPAPIIAEPIHWRSFIPDPLFNLLMGQFPSKRRMIRPISISVLFSGPSSKSVPTTPSTSISISHLWSMSYFM